MQQQTIPRPAAAGSNTYVLPRADVPKTAEEYAALESRINSLREQLQDAAARRNTVADNLKSADEQARSGYVERLQILDQRIIAIEAEISNSVARLAEAPPSARFQASVAQRQPGPEQIAEQALEKVIPVVAILSVFVFFPIAFALSRFIWRRSVSPTPKAAVTDRATQDKLEHLQQSMDAIAIEVERISEGQRFVTKVLADRQIGAGAAEPVARKEAVRSEVR